jgi:hypothetical protein
VRRFGVGVVIGLLALRTPAIPAFDLGFVASRDTTPEGADRLRILGPFFERTAGTNDTVLLALRPFYSRLEEPASDRRVCDLLWPAGSCKDLGDDTDWRLLTVLGHDFDRRDPASRYRVWALPVLFWGRDAHGEEYAAVFPFAGEINEFLGRDRFAFSMFPLFSVSALNDLRTWNVLWPVLSSTESDHLSRFRLFPLYGVYRSDGEFEKRFVLWPLWTSATYRRPGSAGSAWILFPLAGRLNMQHQQAWMFLPPFFRWSRAGEIRSGYALWPVLQYSDGPVRKFYLWPLAGKKTTDREKYRFVLWPIFSQTQDERIEGTVRRTLILPVLYVEKRHVKGAADQPAHSHTVKVWPLGSYRREPGQLSVRALDLWPIKETGPVERNWAPFWTLYTHRRAGADIRDEFLWGLVRHRTSGPGSSRTSIFPLASWSREEGENASREWSVLHGLVGYRRDSNGAAVRLLYVFNIGE